MLLPAQKCIEGGGGGRSLLQGPPLANNTLAEPEQEGGGPAIIIAPLACASFSSQGMAGIALCTKEKQKSRKWTQGFSHDLFFTDFLKSLRVAGAGASIPLPMRFRFPPPSPPARRRPRRRKSVERMMMMHADISSAAAAAPHNSQELGGPGIAAMRSNKLTVNERSERTTGLFERLEYLFCSSLPARNMYLSFVRSPPFSTPLKDEGQDMGVCITEPIALKESLCGSLPPVDILLHC